MSASNQSDPEPGDIIEMRPGPGAALSGRRHRWLVALPAALLILVAARQSHLVFSEHLSPWKGGGLGMFSTLDSPGNRMVRIHLLTPEGPLRVRDGAWRGNERVARLVDQVRTLPDKARLDRLAGLCRRLPWRAADRSAEGLPGQAELVRGGSERLDGRRALRVRGVRVEVWRLSYDRRRREARAVPIEGAVGG